MAVEAKPDDYYPLLHQVKMGSLTINNRGYGLDYYWRQRYLMTSGKDNIIIALGKDDNGRNKCLWFHLACGLQWYGRSLFHFPKWWRDWVMSRFYESVDE